MVGSLKKNDKIDDLLQNWIEYENMMLPHLLEEEEIGLPLFRAYFDPKSASEVTFKILNQASRLELGSFIYFMGEETFRKDVMIRENIPCIAWHLQFKKALKVFVREFIDNVEALRVGKEPVPVKATLKYFILEAIRLTSVPFQLIDKYENSNFELGKVLHINI